jgi:hypothetical protein
VDGEQVFSVTQALELAGLVDTTWFKPIDAWRGKYIHRCLELDAKNDLDEESIRPEMLGYLQAGRQAKYEMGLEIIETEKRIWNPDHRYAGTLDFVAKQRNGRLGVFDYKSGAIGKATNLQLAAYCLGHQMPYQFDRVAIRLRADGKYSCKVYPLTELRDDFNTFRIALRDARERMAA